MKTHAGVDYSDFAATTITDADIAAYERDGAVIIRNAISPEWIETMRQAVDHVLASPGERSTENVAPGQSGRFYGDTFVWLNQPRFGDFILSSPLAELAARMMRARKVNFFYDQLLVKEPRTAGRTPWHQDLPYWPISGWQIASIWVPFDRATPETGVVTYVKGSHLWGKMFEPRRFGPGSPEKRRDSGTALEEAPDIDSHPWDFEFVTGVLEPGDVFVHHARTLHGAPGNSSGSMRRRALATRWAGDDVVWDDRPGTFMRLEKYTGLRKDVSLKDGEPLGGKLFPTVLPRQTADYLAGHG
jgi:ectoine hydroxylase-related dioxygenase (phytanoyl-CoA dioxygenase family)